MATLLDSQYLRKVCFCLPYKCHKEHHFKIQWNYTDKGAPWIPIILYLKNQISTPYHAGERKEENYNQKPAHRRTSLASQHVKVLNNVLILSRLPLRTRCEKSYWISLLSQYIEQLVDHRYLTTILQKYTVKIRFIEILTHFAKFKWMMEYVARHHDRTQNSKPTQL